MILYADDLAETPQRRLEDAGAKIVKPVFSFPGGRRFGRVIVAPIGL